MHTVALNNGTACFAGIGNGLMDVHRMVIQVAGSPSTVLIYGETGTGKELVATAIHALSPRKESTMIKVNCAALPATLIESELFGHEKGSFTGAAERRIGKFELAHKGTLFLDEIGELPLDLQAKLLRVLQEREFERVGGRVPIRTDVRIIAATNKDLRGESELGRFRSDLFYRLFVFPIMIPPLRERKEDIPELAAFFLEKYSRLAGLRLRSLSPGALKQLASYDWPGNVRELEHCIERSVLISSDEVIDQLALHPSKPTRTSHPTTGRRVRTIEEVEREHILAILKLAGGKVSGPGGAAEKLQVAPTTLHSKMKRLGIKRSFKDRG